MRYLFLIASIFLLINCNKYDYESRMRNVIGEWEVVHRVEEIRVDTVYRTSNSEFDIVFNADGTGLKKAYFIFPDIDFTWYYQPTPETYILIGDPTPPVLSSSHAYRVHSNSTKTQVWTYEVRESSFEADYFRNTWLMTKK